MNPKSHLLIRLFLLKFINKQLFLQVFVFLILPSFSYSQSYKINYTPIQSYRIDSLELQNIIQRFTDKCREVRKGQSLPTVKQINEIYNDQKKFLVLLDTINYLMYNDSITWYCKSVMDGILKANPELDKNAILFTRRTIVPNAFTMGEHIIVINLDLLSRLKSESDIALIISHELAHDYLNHFEQHIQTLISFNNDKQIKAKIKKLYKQRYNQYSTLDSLVYSITAKYTQYTRQDEMSADSLGFIYYTRAGYDPSKTASSIMQLDSFDDPLFLKDLNLEKVFTFKDYPFDPAWVFEDTTDLNWVGNTKRELPDSLKTHPICKIRSEALKSYSQSEIKKTHYKDKDLSRLNDESTFELIEHLCNRKSYGYLLYYSLGFLQKYPDNIYINCNIVNALFGISEALKKHRFSRVVGFPDSDNPETYNKLLRMLHQLTYRDMDNMMINYYEHHVQSFCSSDPYAAYIKILIDSRNDDDVKLNTAILLYKTKYTGNPLIKKLDKLLLTHSKN